MSKDSDSDCYSEEDADESCTEDVHFSDCDEVCELHPYLEEDVRMAAREFRSTEDELGVQAVQIEETSLNLICWTAVKLTFPLTTIPECLLRVWELEDTPFISVIFDQVHKSEFRTQDGFPRIFARKGTGDSSHFTVGEQLKNYATTTMRNKYKLSENESPASIGSFFALVYKEIADKLATLTEYCMVCGEKLWAGGVLPSICDRPLCSYQYQELHLYDGLTSPRVSADVMSLLLLAFNYANSSYRRKDILNPAPSIKSLDALVDEANRMGFTKKISGSTESKVLTSLLERLPCPKTLLSSMTSYHEFRQQWPHSALILEWLVISNRSYLERVPDKVNVEFLSTDMQYLFVSDTPAKQAEFDKLVAVNAGKTRFFFHGSPLENWHSIIRGGLKNMSGTKFQLCGAAHGPGIYLSPQLTTSIGYARSSKSESIRSCCIDKGCCVTEVKEAVHCVALVEVVDCPSAYKQGTPQIYVAHSEQWCAIRMLLLYTDKQRKDLKAGCTAKSKETTGIDLSSVTDEEREEINRVVRLFKNADLVERASQHTKVHTTGIRSEVVEDGGEDTRDGEDVEGGK